MYCLYDSFDDTYLLNSGYWEKKGEFGWHSLRTFETFEEAHARKMQLAEGIVVCRVDSRFPSEGP